MPTADQFQQVPVDQIRLDESNPRIAYFLAHLPPPHTPEQIFMALGAGGDDEAGGMPSFNRLKNSIQTNRGIVNPVILREISTQNYICIEGNTRVALYREFREKGMEGAWDTIPAVIHSSLTEDEVHAIRLQAHLVGPRPWTPYAKAKYLTYLRNEEHFEFNRLVDFCGGNPKSIQEALDAFADMEAHYRPHLEDDGEFDIKRFSGFVELQKAGVKESIAQASLTLDDFGKWIKDGKIDKLAHVRWLPKILKNKKATAVFLKSGIEDAISLTDAPDLTKQLQEASIASLARALTEALRKIEYREVKKLKDDPGSQTSQYLLEAHEALKEIMADVGLE